MSTKTNPNWVVRHFPGDINQQITYLVERGYVIAFRDQQTAQLIKKKQFSCLIGLLSFLLFGVGFVLYGIWFLAQTDETIYLDIRTQDKSDL